MVSFDYLGLKDITLYSPSFYPRHQDFSCTLPNIFYLVSVIIIIIIFANYREIFSLITTIITKILNDQLSIIWAWLSILKAINDNWCLAKCTAYCFNLNVLPPSPPPSHLMYVILIWYVCVYHPYVDYFIEFIHFNFFFSFLIELLFVKYPSCR